MFWMLLPPSSNAGRHLDEGALPHNVKGANLFRSVWGIVRHLFALT
jgi:hypothetical protein